MKHPRLSISPQEATEAICQVLDTLSFIRRQDIRMDPFPSDRRIGLLVRVNVFGHTYTLACALHSRDFPDGLDAALFDIHSAALALGCSALPVLIAPQLAPEAQVQCSQHHIAYLDLEGNAHLDVGEIFIARRAVYPHRAAASAPALPYGVAPVFSPQPPAQQAGSFPC